MNMDIYFESMSEIFMKQNKAMDDTALLSKFSIHYWEKQSRLRSFLLGVSCPLYTRPQPRDKFILKAINS